MPEDGGEQESIEAPHLQRSSGIAAYGVIFTFTQRSHYLILLNATFFATLLGFIKPAISILTGRFLTSFTNYAAGSISDDSVKHDTSSTIYALAVVGLLSWLLRASFCAVWIAYGESQAKAVRESLFSALLVRHLGWFEAQEAGVSTLLSRIQTQILDFQSGTSQPLGTVVLILVQSVASLAVAFYYSWKLTLVVLAFFPLIAGGLSWLSRGYRQALDNQQAELTLATKQLLHSIQNIVLLKCYNTQDQEVARYSRTITSSDMQFRQQTRVSASQVAFMRLASAAILVATLGFGTYLVHEADTNAGDIMTTFWSATTGAKGITDILNQLLVLEKGRAAAAALRLLLLEVEQGALLLEDHRGKAPTKLEGDIEFSDVTFLYPSRPDRKVLDGVNFFFPAHELTFVVGKSGSGKSSLTALLLRFYTVESGCIELDGIDLKRLDTWWLRNNITLVQQSSILFSGTIQDNIAICCNDNHQPSQLDLVQCLEFADLHSVIEALPDGTDTQVGKGGTSLSGGQRQRMALARARLRDTPILLLDESTSALDHTAKVRIMHNIRKWRKGKTTIVITHDLSQIRSGDFMYVLKDGKLISEGYRQDVVIQLQQSGNGDMIGRPLTPPGNDIEEPNRRKTRHEHLLRPDLARIRSTNSTELSDAETFDTAATSMRESTLLIDKVNMRTPEIFNMRKGWKTRATVLMGHNSVQSSVLRRSKDTTNDTELVRLGTSTYQRKALSTVIQKTQKVNVEIPMPRRLHDRLTMTPSARRYTVYPSLTLHRAFEEQDVSQPSPATPIKIWVDETKDSIQHKNDDSAAKSSHSLEAPFSVHAPTFSQIMYTIWPSLDIKQKQSLVIGLCAAGFYGALPALSSWLMSHLFENFQQLTAWQRDAVKWSLILIAVSFLDGGLLFLAQYLLETTGQSWVRALRRQAVGQVLQQPKSWFDSEDMSLNEICATLDKAAEDVRKLLGRFTAVILIATVTVFIAVAWSMVICWKLTLVSLSSAPIVYGIIKTLNTVSYRWQARSTEAAIGVAEVFSESFSDVRTVRALTLESRFHHRFMASTSSAFRVGLQRGLYIGLSSGASDSIMPLMTASIFAYSIKLATSHDASTESIITAIVMMIFCLTSASTLLSTVPQIASSLEAGGRLLHLTRLPPCLNKQKGLIEIPAQAFVGRVAFHKVSFAYPSRKDVLVLKDLQLIIPESSFTALVGKSGCGKSTIISLLLCLYDAADRDGCSRVLISEHNVKQLNVASLRSHVVYMPQQAVLFPMSIKDNILYGSENNHDSHVPQDDQLQDAARSAGIHDFVMSLPSGYDTLVGDGGLSVSGGQAQRIALARGFARRSKIMLLDEPTSALDQESARTVRQSLLSLAERPVSERPTIIVVTHSKEMMEIAQNIVMLKDGSVAEQGTYRALMGRQGDFFHMMLAE